MEEETAPAQKKSSLPLEKKLQIRELQLNEAVARANLAHAKSEYAAAANELSKNFPNNLDPNTLEFKQ